MPNLVTDPLVGLSEVRFGTAPYDGLTPLSGICCFETDCPPHRPVEKVALRLKYFRPDLPHAVTAMWYANGHVRAPGGEFQFQFPPVFSKKDLSNLHGTMVVFLQMFTAEDWRRMAGCRKISNVASAVINLQ